MKFSTDFLEEWLVAHDVLYSAGQCVFMYVLL